MRMRARMLVSYTLFWALINALSLFSVKLLSPTQILVVVSSFLVNAVTPFMIKASFSVGKILLGLVGFFLLLQIFVLRLSDSLDLNLIFGFIYITWSACILSSGLGTLVAATIMTSSATLISYFIFSHKPKTFFVGTTPHEAVGVLFPLTLTVVFYFFAFLIFRKIRTLAQLELDREIEWQYRVNVLEEISSIAGITGTLLSGPLTSFRNGVQNLNQESDASQLDRMQTQIDELLLISQSFAWIYRAHGGGGTYSILSSNLTRQLEVLLTCKAQKEGWTFGIEHRGSPVEISGPVPSIVLFLFTLSAHILEEKQPLEKRHLTLEFDHKGNQATWKLRWPYALGHESLRDVRKSELSTSFSDRQEMIRDLSRVCAARVQYSRKEDAQEILVKGSWQRPG